MRRGESRCSRPRETQTWLDPFGEQVLGSESPTDIAPQSLHFPVIAFYKLGRLLQGQGGFSSSCGDTW